MYSVYDRTRRSEERRVISDLKANGYPEYFIKSVDQKPRENPKAYASIPYIKGVSERIRRILNRENIRTAFKPIKTLVHVIKKPKDVSPKEQLKGIVYKVSCRTCPFTDVGESKRSWKSRGAEHKPGTNGNVRSAVKQHAEATVHDIHPNYANILETGVTTKNKRLRTGIETWRREELSHLRSHNFWQYLVLMAETLLNYVTKRRNRSSDSSADGRVESPEAKKAKNADNLEILAANREHAGDASEEDSDIVLTALELTDDLSGILKGILEKLNKLDTIERAVKKIEGSLVKLEERTTKLEALEKTAREDIDNLKANHAIIEKEQDDTKDALDKKIKGLDGKIAELADKERKISQTLDDLNTKDLYLEAYSRRANIKFNKIKESPMLPNESENTEEVLRFFLEKQLGYQNARSVEIQRVHRLGKKREDGGARPILARFLRFKDCEEILALGSRLKGTNFQMFRDLPQELVTRRSKQMDTFKKAKRNNIPVSFSKSQPDKLYVRVASGPGTRDIVEPTEPYF